MKSAIFKGQVKHRRILPKKHSFQYRMFLMYLDLEELGEVFRGRWFWSVKRAAFARFHRSDHFGHRGDLVGIPEIDLEGVSEHLGHAALTADQDRHVVSQRLQRHQPKRF